MRLHLNMVRQIDTKINKIKSDCMLKSTRKCISYFIICLQWSTYCILIARYHQRTGKMNALDAWYAMPHLFLSFIILLIEQLIQQIMKHSDKRNKRIASSYLDIKFSFYTWAHKLRKREEKTYAKILHTASMNSMRMVNLIQIK